MGQTNGNRKDEFRAAITMTVIWVAGLTLATIFAALFAGIMLDQVLKSKPLFTILLVVASIPVTIYLTIRVVKSASSKIQAQPAEKKVRFEEEPHRGEDD